MQAFKRELMKKIKKIERKEKISSIIKKVSEYGSIYGQQGASKLPDHILERRQDQRIPKARSPLKYGHISDEYYQL